MPSGLWKLTISDSYISCYPLKQIKDPTLNVLFNDSFSNCIYTFTKKKILQLVEKQSFNVFSLYCHVSPCGNYSCCFCNLTSVFKERFSRWYWIRVTARREGTNCVFSMTAEYMHISCTVIRWKVFVHWSSHHCQDGAVQYSTLTTKNGVEALVFESLCLLKNFQKTLFQTCSIQPKALQNKVGAGDTNSSGWEEAASLWPECSVSLHVFVVGTTDWLPTNTEMQILWSNNVMHTIVWSWAGLCSVRGTPVPV